MTFPASGALAGVLASIPSPPSNSFTVFGRPITYYAICIIVGIVVAVFITNHRLTKRGAESWVVIDISLIAVPLAIIFARAYHVLTHTGFYFGPGRNPMSAFYIWEGGIAIYGALIGGAIGAWLGCRWTGIRFTSFADALAPALLVAQAIGRLGNWFNQELFGLPTTLPWGLQVSPTNPAIPVGLPAGTLFHPTFLYEMIWNLLGAAVLVWAGKRFRLQWGRLFALYLVWYSAGRIVWESIRIDPSDVYLGLRTNVWAAIFGVMLGLVIFYVQKRRHPGYEPSVYMSGRQPKSKLAVDSSNTDDFVDVSEPPATEVEGKATSTAAIE